MPSRQYGSGNCAALASVHLLAGSGVVLTVARPEADKISPSRIAIENAVSRALSSCGGVG